MSTEHKPYTPNEASAMIDALALFHGAEKEKVECMSTVIHYLLFEVEELKRELAHLRYMTIG